jgi:hypothetical protein
MDLSKEMNKPLFVVRENGESSFVSPNQLKSNDLKARMASLYAYLAKKLSIKEVPRTVLTTSQENSQNPFGMTGYYDPEKKSIRLYVTDRHDTDILRSFAHEVIHHWQNENGTLHDNGVGVKAASHYAQNDENLRKREMEAYLFGNILFRDWQDENRYGPPATPPTMPQPIQENLQIVHSNKVKEGLKKLVAHFVETGTITSFNRELSSGQMNPADFVEDLASKLTTTLNSVIQGINDRSNWESQGDMIQEEKE